MRVAAALLVALVSIGIAILLAKGLRISFEDGKAQVRLGGKPFELSKLTEPCPALVCKNGLLQMPASANPLCLSPIGERCA